MQLSHILYPSECLGTARLDLSIGKPCADTRELSPLDVFFSENGTSYIGEAIQKGAAAVIAQMNDVIPPLPVPLFKVENVRRQYAIAWRRYTSKPDAHIKLLAVTGTNGKTSVSFFLSALLYAAGYTTGLVGTVEYSDGVNRYPSDYTTPPPDKLYPLLKKMNENRAAFCVMEASSHAIAQERLHGLSFETAIFINLSRDHLDYHRTWDAYKMTKAALFRHAKTALINLDDASAREIGWEATGNVYYFGKDPCADFVIKNPACTADGIRYTLETPDGDIPVEIPIVGDFHVYNSAAAIACAFLAGVPAETLTETAKLLKPPSGRLEKLDTGTNYAVYIDYAHTPDALEKALLALRMHTDRLTVLFGAGGDRDRGKRPEMGAAAEKLADRIILTSDNPRGEAPDAIIDDIARGIHAKNITRIPDRKSAIEYALQTARAGEILLFAGKGHETYIIDKNGKHRFSEREIVYKYLERKGKENVSQLE